MRLDPLLLKSPKELLLNSKPWDVFFSHFTGEVPDDYKKRFLNQLSQDLCHIIQKDLQKILEKMKEERHGKR